MEDYRLEQSGQEVQNILNGAAMQSDLTAETERATEAEQTLQGNIDIEERDRKAADLTLQGNIDAEELRAKAAEKQNADDIDALEDKVPSGASASNKLATESYVDDSVATASATFRGTFNLVSDLHLTLDATEFQIATQLSLAIATADNNDYCFIQVPTSSETPTEIKEIDRYKFNGTAWGFEYKLNNSGFTAAQWAAINSGITSNDVTKLAALPTNAQLTTLLNGKQDVLTFDNVPTEGSSHPVKSGGVYSAINDEKTARETADSSLSSAIEAILLLIPSAATSLNKLADKAFVNSSIATASATFRGTYNLVTDLSLTVSATHAQIATALAGAVSDEDNNDYAFVQIPTADATPTQIAKTERYKYNGTAWEYEYDLNNSGYTAAQWAAINSGITEALVTKLSALPTNTELTSALGVLTSSITTINQKIPSAASQANQLVDTAAMESYIVQVLDVLTASFNVTSSDGHVTVSISQVDGKITSVSVNTSDIASAASLSLIAGRVTTAEGNISTNAADIANLQAAYAALTQSDIVVVEGALPSSGQQQNIIYRQPDPDHTPPQFYSDYMWNGTAWVLMATYNNAIDPRPKKASQNLVTSGGVFDNMGALDVSELNATENPHTLAKYIDLSAALAAIPTDYRKGGMSIKFVQSSDNKYVQYRLMSDSFNTNSDNWQGVDEKAIAWSRNIIESRGVYREFLKSIWRTFSNSYPINKQTFALLKNFKAGDSLIVRLRNVYIENQQGENNYIALQIRDYSDNVLLTINDIKNGAVINQKYPFSSDCLDGIYLVCFTIPNKTYQYRFDILVDDYLMYCQELTEHFEKIEKNEIISISQIAYLKVLNADIAAASSQELKYLIYYNPQNDDYYIEKMSLGYDGEIGDVVKLHVGFIDQRNNWIETSVYETTVKEKESYVSKLVLDDVLYVPKNNVVAVEFNVSNARWTYKIGDIPQYPPFMVLRNLNDAIDIAGRTDIEWGYYSVDVVVIKKNSPFATKNEVSDVKDSVKLISDQSSMAKIFVDRITGEKYRLEVNNGVLSLIANTYHNVLIIGNSFMLHPVSQDRWWANRGMAASVDANQYTQKLYDLLALNSLAKLSGVSFERNVNQSQSYDFETQIPISSSNNYDLVIIQLGENSSLTNRNNFVNNWKSLINYIISKCPQANIIQVIGWSNGDKLSAITEACASKNVQVIDCRDETLTGNLRLGDYVTEDGNITLHSVPSLILTHPSDVGMILIANKIVSSLGFSEQVPMYNITINGAVGGTISCCYNKWPAFGVVSFKIEPESGYQLSSIVITDAQNNTVTHQSLSNDNGDYACIFMPQSNITVTPTFISI